MSSCRRTKSERQGLWQRVGLYWWLGLDPSWPQSGWTGIHDQNGQVFSDTRDGYYAWSAAFICYVMRLAGAGGSFPYSENHADYINAAARHDPGVRPDGRAGRSLRAAAWRFDLLMARPAGDLRPAAGRQVPRSLRHRRRHQAGSARRYRRQCRQRGGDEIYPGHRRRPPRRAGRRCARPRPPLVRRAEGAVSAGRIPAPQPRFRLRHRTAMVRLSGYAAATSRPRPLSIIVSASQGSRSSAMR